MKYLAEPGDVDVRLRLDGKESQSLVAGRHLLGEVDC